MNKNKSLLVITSKTKEEMLDIEYVTGKFIISLSLSLIDL